MRVYSAIVAKCWNSNTQTDHFLFTEMWIMTLILFVCNFFFVVAGKIRLFLSRPLTTPICVRLENRCLATEIVECFCATESRWDARPKRLCRQNEKEKSFIEMRLLTSLGRLCACGLFECIAQSLTIESYIIYRKGNARDAHSVDVRISSFRRFHFIWYSLCARIKKKKWRTLTLRSNQKDKKKLHIFIR